MLIVCYASVLHPQILANFPFVLCNISFDGFNSHASGERGDSLAYFIFIKCLFRTTGKVLWLGRTPLVFSCGRTILSAMAMVHSVFTAQVVIANHNYFRWCRTSI